jgi:hypothetical protein
VKFSEDISGYSNVRPATIIVLMWWQHTRIPKSVPERSSSELKKRFMSAVYVVPSKLDVAKFTVVVNNRCAIHLCTLVGDDFGPPTVVVESTKSELRRVSYQFVTASSTRDWNPGASRTLAPLRGGKVGTVRYGMFCNMVFVALGMHWRKAVLAPDFQWYQGLLEYWRRKL